ncbi:hypothetical protein [Hyphomicrobium sp.]|uniref:hypothetical protein n=1 Tax=Hyphomicrobium sp. TaxID=82 RepID=UPI001D88831B|nr:hypothetical protein [Hyphomicrobium sp.]MBY0560059.1 hypothetical protein [Hyphomicrobium sp.]
MPKYKVTIQQFVEEVAEVTITAASPEEAMQLAQEGVDDGSLDIDWSDGSDVMEAKAIRARPIARKVSKPVEPDDWIVVCN